MDTAKVLKRQLSYCMRAAETDAQRAQVRWWLDQVAAAEGNQPSAEQPGTPPPASAGQPAHAHAEAA